MTMSEPRPFHPVARGPASQRSSVLVIVMITLIFTAVALTAFIERASNDLLIEARDADAGRLRQEAYSALEVTIAVLEDFRQADNGLHSPNEGWSDPIAWSGWTPTEGRTVEVSLQDESAKIPLTHTDITTLTNLFVGWQMLPDRAESVADALLGWMKNGYVYTTPLTVDYEQDPVAYDAPGRALRAYSELAAIDGAREVFFDDTGLPNANYWRFVADCSIFNFATPNVNGANGDVLAAVGQYTDVQKQHISDFLTGTGQYANQNQQWFQNPAMLAGVAGLGGQAGGFGTTVTALRVLVTVREGRSRFQLSAVIAPQGGASLVQTSAVNATAGNTSSSASTTTSVTAASKPGSTAVASTTAASVPQNLSYPFTILQLLENDEIPPPPPLPAPLT
jgi:general secretion pathway protein K